MKRDIQLEESDSSKVGRCNGCTDNMNSDVAYRVWTTTFRSIAFRLCEKCMIEYAKKSGTALRSTN